MNQMFDQHMTDDLAQEMVHEGLITVDQLAVAQVSHEDLGEALGHILVKKGYVTEAQFLDFLGRQLSIPYLSLKEVKVQRELVQKVSVHLALRYHLIPIRQEGPAVVVAMADPLDHFALDDLRSALHFEIKPVLASAEEVDDLICQSYGLPQKNHRPTEEALETIRHAPEESVDFVGEEPEQIAIGPKVVQLVNQMILSAYREHASDIHLEPERDFVRIRYRIDGFLEEKQKLTRALQLPVVSRIKIMAGLDIAERRIPQDGRVGLRMGRGMLDLRVATYPTLNGEKVVLRLLAKGGLVGIESLGFSEEDRKAFADLISRSHGIFLVTGPTGSGKSTTLYAALNRLNSPDKNIISIEDPIESEIPGVNQAQINPKAGLTFASALRSILRQDPDVIMLGEIRDRETAEIAVRAAITGHLVLSTLHTNTAAGAISRLADLGVEPFLISTALIGVLAQRLVRKICPQCRIIDQPDRTALGELSSYVQQSFRGRGCEGCRMSGYTSRIGMFELAPIGDSVKKLLGKTKNDRDIEMEFRRLGIRSMLQDGFDKVNQGVTTIEEVLRVTREE